MKTCNICSETKPLSDYYYQVGKPMRRCKACQCAYARAWAELSKDKIMATRVKYKDSKYRTKVVRQDRAAERLVNAGRTT